MTVRISVEADLVEVRRYFRELGPGVDRAAARALNDTITTVRAKGARAIKARHKALKIGDIKREMNVSRARPGHLTAAVSVHGRPLPLRFFRAKQLKSGTKATIGQNRILLGIAGRRVFQIASKGGDFFIRRKGGGRRIRRYRGPSLPGAFRAQEGEFREIAIDRWRVTFPNRLRFELDKAIRAAQRG